MNTARIAAIAFSALLAAGTTVGAHADSVTETVQVKVSPYELATVDGRTAALGRIERASVRLCAPEGKIFSHAQRDACQSRTQEQMVRQLGSPALLAQWSGKRGIETASRD